jgi:hypothetical protein
MKYGEIKWKVEKIVFKIDGRIIKRKFEVDEGRTFIKKPPGTGESYLTEAPCTRPL